MGYWRYRAFDCAQTIHSGVIAGDDVGYMALHLRQKGLQLIQLDKIEFDDYLVEKQIDDRLARLQQRLAPIEQFEPTRGSRGSYRVVAILFIFILFVLLLVQLYR